MDASKVALVQKARQLASTLAQCYSEMTDLQEVYDHRMYGPGGANELVAEDIAIAVGSNTPALDPDALYAFVIVCAQLKEFMENGIPAQSDHKAVLDRVRQDM